MSWPVVRLSEVATIDRKGVDPTEIASGTEYIGLEHIESGGRILGSQMVVNGELASTKYHFGPNHILYGKLRPYLAKIATPGFDGVCSTDILPINPGPRIDRKFLAYFLLQPSMVDFAASRSTGANLPRLSPKALAEFEIPLPPLEEQKRIAAILDQADSLRRLRQRAMDRLNTLGQAIFYEMFGDWRFGRSPYGRTNLGSKLEFLTSGSRGWAKYYSESGSKFIRIQNVGRDFFDQSDMAFVDAPNSAEARRTRVQAGDVLLSITADLGRTAVVPKGLGDAYINQHLALLRGSYFNPRFLSAALASPSGQVEMVKKNRAGVKAGLNFDDVRSI
jgi:type I restriction enzyme, S subunit